MLSEQDRDDLKRLEASLWRKETRFDRAYMERTFAPDFFEFGRSGRTYTREQMFGGSGEIRATLKNIVVHEITADVALVTYVSEVMYEQLEIGNRSSLWSRTPSGWKLRFHQGTAVTTS